MAEAARFLEVTSSEAMPGRPRPDRSRAPAKPSGRAPREREKKSGKAGIVRKDFAVTRSNDERCWCDRLWWIVAVSGFLLLLDSIADRSGKNHVSCVAIFGSLERSEVALAGLPLMSWIFGILATLIVLRNNKKNRPKRFMRLPHLPFDLIEGEADEREMNRPLFRWIGTLIFMIPPFIMLIFYSVEFFVLGEIFYASNSGGEQKIELVSKGLEMFINFGLNDFLESIGIKDARSEAFTFAYEYGPRCFLLSSNGRGCYFFLGLLLLGVFASTLCSKEPQPIPKLTAMISFRRIAEGKFLPR